MEEIILDTLRDVTEAPDMQLVDRISDHIVDSLDAMDLGFRLKHRLGLNKDQVEEVFLAVLHKRQSTIGDMVAAIASRCPVSVQAQGEAHGGEL